MQLIKQVRYLQATKAGKYKTTFMAFKKWLTVKDIINLLKKPQWWNVIPRSIKQIRYFVEQKKVKKKGILL